MINANELRIGNIVISGFDITEDGKKAVYKKIETGSDIDLSDNYEPVPLTPKKLKEYGIDFFFLYGSDGNSVYILLNNSVFKLPDICLHRLQNLLFTLTGEELQIDIQRL